MKKKIILLILSAVTALSFAVFGSVYAQTVDVSSMNNEQLIDLLQSIMQQLNSEPTAEPTEIALPTATPTAIPAPTNTPTPELTDDNAMVIMLLQQILDKLSEDPTAASPEPTAAPAAEAAATEVPQMFEIYTNKKLFLERIPDDKLIPKDNGKDTDGGDPGKKKNTPSCEEGCYYDCRFLSGIEICGCFCSDG